MEDENNTEPLEDVDSGADTVAPIVTGGLEDVDGGVSHGVGPVHEPDPLEGAEAGSGEDAGPEDSDLLEGVDGGLMPEIPSTTNTKTSLNIVEDPGAAVDGNR